MDFLNAEDLVIRPFAQGDRPMVEDFFAHLGEEGTFFFNGDGINEKPALAWFEGKSRENLYFLAEYEGKMIGFLVFYDYHWKTPWLGIALREDAKNAAECLEAIEKMLYLIDEYSRYKTSFVEDSINGLFRIARFRLFREQANGGVEDRCDVVYDGVPYISVNNGMKINLGIDIINTLSTAYGVRVPLFVDNAESVTKLEKCGSQIIRLVVSENDKELRVNYEN